MVNKFTKKLLPEDQRWVDELRAHPERQMKNKLGIVDTNNNLISACCLGQRLHLSKYFSKYFGVNVGYLVEDTGDPDDNHCEELLEATYGNFNLRSSEGKLFKTIYIVDRKIYLNRDEAYAVAKYQEDVCDIDNLAEFNDIIPDSWGLIADFIEQYPWYVFTNNYYQQDNEE